MQDIFKNRKEWRVVRKEPGVEMPSVKRAREEFEGAVDSGDFEKAREALEKLRGAQIYQAKRLR